VLHGNFGKDLASVVFGLLFQAVALSIIGAILLAVSALRGTVELEWLARFGLALQLMGLMLLVLDYAGADRTGPSQLRWWVRYHTGSAGPGSRPDTWPGQVVIILAVAALVVGLVLQLLGTFS
jgi:hypothetical protein